MNEDIERNTNNPKDRVRNNMPSLRADTGWKLLEKVVRCLVAMRSAIKNFVAHMQCTGWRVVPPLHLPCPPIVRNRYVLRPMTTLGVSHGAGLRSGSCLVFDAPHIVVNDLLDGFFSLLLDVMLANLAFVLPEATRCN